MRAKITILFDDPQKARAIAKSLTPDNITTSGVKILTRAKGRKVETEISHGGRIQTLLATIEDLLMCTQTADRILQAADAKRPLHRHIRGSRQTI